MRRAIAAVVDFIVGDDVWVALGVGAAIAVTAVLARLPLDPWWLLPLAVPAVVAVSLLRTAGLGSRTGSRRRSAG